MPMLGKNKRSIR